jgi:hypothetical protein
MAALLALRFLAELGLLAALAWGGWHADDDTALRLLLAVGLPVLAALVWGRWVAPRAPRRLNDPARLAVEVTLFTAAVLLMLAGEPTATTGIWAIALATAFLVSVPARGHEPTQRGT